MDKYKYPPRRDRPADIIREHVRSTYLDPAVKRHAKTVTVVAGDVARQLGLKNRTPAVCSALRSYALLNENHITIEKDEGPASGMSTTVKITYRLPTEEAATNGQDDATAAFMALRGILKGSCPSLTEDILKGREEFEEAMSERERLMGFSRTS